MWIFLHVLQVLGCTFSTGFLLPAKHLLDIKSLPVAITNSNSERAKVQFRARTLAMQIEKSHQDSALRCQDATVLHSQSSSILKRQYWTTPIRVDMLVEVELLLLTLSIGVQDAISFPDFRCFASNQTGNTVLLAVSASGYGAQLFDISNIGMSLAMFLLGAFLTGQIGNLVGATRRSWLLSTHIFQTLMVFGAAIIQYTKDDGSVGMYALGAIALLAFSSGSQVASMRPMAIPEITTAMATAAWVDLVIDPMLAQIRNRPRNRRTLFLLFLIAGSFIGAFMRQTVGSPHALVVSGAGKVAVLTLFFFNKAKPQVVKTEIV